LTSNLDFENRTGKTHNRYIDQAREWNTEEDLSIRDSGKNCFSS